MIELHPQVINKNGNDFVLLPFEEYEALKEMIEDYKDLLDLRNAKIDEGKAKTLSLEEVEERLASQSVE